MASRKDLWLLVSCAGSEDGTHGAVIVGAKDAKVASAVVRGSTGWDPHHVFPVGRVCRLVGSPGLRLEDIA